MRRSLGQYVLCLLGGLCCVAGFVAWAGMAWKAFAITDEVSP